MKNIDDRILLRVENKIATVSFSRQEKHNALDMPMFKAIDKTIKLLKSRRDIRVVIVRGEGPSFCSGLDIKSVMTNNTNALKLLWKWLPGNANLAQRVTVGWRRLKVPVIMAIHGKCWGGGMQIALGGDYRIVSPESSLSIMESRWGLIPDMGGTVALSEIMHSDHAMKLAMTAETLTAEDALKRNLVSQVDDEPYKAAIKFAESLVERSPDVLSAIKKAYHKIWCASERKILAKETLSQWGIIFGKNRAIAVKKAMGNDKVDFV